MLLKWGNPLNKTRRAVSAAMIRYVCERCSFHHGNTPLNRVEDDCLGGSILFLKDLLNWFRSL